MLVRRTLVAVAIFAVVVSVRSSAWGADVILNEYNAVDDGVLLEQVDAVDPFWGRRGGNGGDWFEVVVVTDHLDMRGWEFHVANDVGGTSPQSFLLKLTTNAAWSDIRRGTIITFSEDLDNNVAQYQPEAGRWWINVRATAGTVTYVNVSCISPACSPSTVNWKVSNNNWQLTIKDDVAATVFGPAGEGIKPTSGVGSQEVCKLEQDPGTGVTPLSNYNDGSSSTFGEPNQWSSGTVSQNFSALRSVVPYSPLTSVRINEVSTHSDPGLDWVELRNTTDQPLDIGGWFISDSFDSLTDYEIPANTIIPAQGYLVFDQTDLGFGFSSPCGDQVILSQGNGVVPTGPRDFFEFGAVDSGVTLGRYPDGSGPMTRLVDETPGSGNAPPLLGPVVINELMYHPPTPVPPSTLDAEFIELRNLTAFPVTLATNYGASGTYGWRLSGGVDFQFATTTTIAANGFLVVVNFDPVAAPALLAEFRAYYGISASVPVVGPYTSKLDNFSDTVRLRKPDTPEPNGDVCGGSGNPSPFVPYVIIDEVTYFDFGAWPMSPDGEGASLERVDGHAFGNDSSNWSANVTHGATPGTANSTYGPATSAQQSCANVLNSNLSKVLKAQGTAAYGCLRSGTSERLPPGIDIESCVAGDLEGRVADAALATLNAYQQSCTGTSALEPRLGFYGPRNAAVLNAAAIAAGIEQLHDLFGPDLDASIALQGDDSDASRCQIGVMRALKKCIEEQVRAFNSCKKSSMASSLVSQSSDLLPCIGIDPKGKVAKACGAATGKVRQAIDGACVAAGVSLVDAFPGCGLAGAQATAQCAQRSGVCRACLAVSVGDGLGADCDLEDDIIDNDSCP